MRIEKGSYNKLIAFKSVPNGAVFTYKGCAYISTTSSTSPALCLETGTLVNIHDDVLVEHKLNAVVYLEPNE